MVAVPLAESTLVHRSEALTLRSAPEPAGGWPSHTHFRSHFRATMGGDVATRGRPKAEQALRDEERLTLEKICAMQRSWSSSSGALPS